MTIESAPGRAVVILSREELERYGVSCAAMSLYDDRTRVLLGDMLTVLAVQTLWSLPFSALTYYLPRKWSHERIG